MRCKAQRGEAQGIKWWDRVRGAAVARGVGWLTVQWPALVQKSGAGAEYINRVAHAPQTRPSRRSRPGSSEIPTPACSAADGTGPWPHPSGAPPPQDWAAACGAPAAERAARVVARRRSVRSPAARGRSRVAWAGLWGTACAAAPEPAIDFGRARKGLAHQPPPRPTRTRL